MQTREGHYIGTGGETSEGILPLAPSAAGGQPEGKSAFYTEHQIGSYWAVGHDNEDGRFILNGVSYAQAEYARTLLAMDAEYWKDGDEWDWPRLLVAVAVVGCSRCERVEVFAAEVDADGRCRECQP
jgi:hypothetical protein